MNIALIFDKGGPVVWILAALSVLALSIVIERLLHFWRMGRLPADFDTTKPDAATLAQLRGPEAAVLKGLVQASFEGVSNLERVAARIGSGELQRMERGLGILGVIGNSAPLLGLFGTIAGMIKAFMVIESAGGKVDAEMLAGGIWEAMVTTGVGLAVAIPVLFLLHWLEGMADARAHAMQYHASLFIEQSGQQPSHSESDRIRHHGERADAV
jgi:biopolymer transport protein ExbB